MTAPKKPTIKDLVADIEGLELALDQMFAAFKNDLAVLRRKVEQLAPSVPTKPPAAGDAFR